MPILEVQPVLDDGVTIDAGLARRVADAAAQVYGSAPGHVWVRLAPLPAAQYAENGIDADVTPRPVFVTVLHAQPPAGEALAREVQALTQALAAVFAQAPERVHVQIAPAASGRQAFGGTLLP